MKIDLQFMESLYSQVNDSNPLLKLESRTLTTEELQEKYLHPGITIQYPTGRFLSISFRGRMEGSR